MRSKPAELLFIRQIALERAKLRHNILDWLPDEALGVKSRRFANELVPLTECKGQADACATTIILEFGDGIGIDRVTMNRITAMTIANRIADIANGNALNHDAAQRR